VSKQSDEAAELVRFKRNRMADFEAKNPTLFNSDEVQARIKFLNENVRDKTKYGLSLMALGNHSLKRIIPPGK